MQLVFQPPIENTMQEIFDKIEKAKVQFLDLLQPEEKQHCQELFEKYSSHFQFIKKLSHETIEGYSSHTEQVPLASDDFYYCISKMEKQISNYEEILTGLHKIVARKTEMYFREKYNIEFISLTELKKPDEITQPYELENVIENMFEQVGTDLIQSGKNQIIEHLQKLFTTAFQQPEIRNNKISLPRYYSLGYGLTTSLDYNDSKVKDLLLAISLILFDTITMPESFELLFQEWKNELKYSNAYYLQTDLIIKFFKNRRIDISFPSVYTAEKFWQLFQLENIVEINNS